MTCREFLDDPAFVQPLCADGRLILEAEWLYSF